MVSCYEGFEGQTVHENVLGRVAGLSACHLELASKGLAAVTVEHL